MTDKQVVKRITQYSDGTEVRESWYANGQQEYREEYRDGEPHGIVEGWYENGQQEYRTEYRNGKLIRNLMEEDK